MNKKCEIHCTIIGSEHKLLKSNVSYLKKPIKNFAFGYKELNNDLVKSAILVRLNNVLSSHIIRRTRVFNPSFIKGNNLTQHIPIHNASSVA